MKNEFQIREVLKQIQDSFGGKPYSEVQISIISDLVEIYGLKAFKAVGKKLLEESSRKPYPIDFKTQLKNMGGLVNRSFDDYAITCKSCMDTGYVFINDPDVEIVAKCFCDFYDEHDGRKLPRIEKSMQGLIKVFPVDFFKPAPHSFSSEKVLSFDKKPEINSVVQKWKNLIKSSERYWSKT